jgi:hypothetical protein
LKTLNLTRRKLAKVPLAKHYLCADLVYSPAWRLTATSSPTASTDTNPWICRSRTTSYEVRFCKYRTVLVALLLPPAQCGDKRKATCFQRNGLYKPCSRSVHAVSPQDAAGPVLSQARARFLKFASKRMLQHTTLNCDHVNIAVVY